MRRLRPVVLLMLWCAGCGYSSRSLIDEQYRTVYVDTFDNQSRYRGFGQSLTRALVNQINSRTQLRIVPRTQAQTLITGQINDVTQTVLTEDGRDEVRELLLTVSVDMTWTDQRTGRPIRVVRKLVVSEPVKRDLGQTIESQSGEVFEDLAERLVESLEGDW